MSLQTRRQNSSVVREGQECDKQDFPTQGLTRPQPCYCEGASLILNIKVQDAPSGAEQGADLESALQTMKRAAKP
ncbi:hypothetical protein BDR07DRAFT_1501078 [Suillus spraguei]|nr:hypothetical protein BDR07DRAFT_1501078 [Suillus spraguei]